MSKDNPVAILYDALGNPISVVDQDTGAGSEFVLGTTMRDRSGSGTITSAAGPTSIVEATTNGASSVIFAITGTYVATLIFEYSVDGVTYSADAGASGTPNTVMYTSPFNGSFTVNCGGKKFVRVRATAFTSGTVNIAWNAGLQSGILSSSTPDRSVSFGLAALNDQGVLPMPGAGGAAVQFYASTMIGTVVAEYSIDDGVSWSPAFFHDASSGQVESSLVFAGGSNPLTVRSFITISGASHYRVRVSAYTSGTINALFRATTMSGYDTSEKVPTYSASIVGLVAAATPTDVFTIAGSATKTIRVLKVIVTGTQTTAANRDVLLLKRSTADTAGTSTAPVKVGWDSKYAAATATVLAYTANPTLGTLVGAIRNKKLLVSTTALQSDELEVNFTDSPDGGLVLRGTAEQLAVNLNSVTSAGNSFDITVWWTES